MSGFMIRFLICNLLLSILIGILLAVRPLLGKVLSGRMQYRLWFLLLGLLAVPFLPFRLAEIPALLSRLNVFPALALSRASGAMGRETQAALSGGADWMEDLTLSVSSAPSIAGTVLLAVWLIGILVMLMAAIKSSLWLRGVKRSALPLQNPEIRRLYRRCLDELHVKKEIPLYSSAFLQSPVITGLRKPRIYFPTRIICGRREAGAGTDGLSPVRYMLLHELQHYRHKDVLAGYLMALFGIVYWFNPMVWLALREMRIDREVACDTSVLDMLAPDSYEDYGETLLRYAETLSRPASDFAAGLGGNMAQMKRRIINIASYQKPSLRKQLAGLAAFLAVAALFLGSAPLLPANAAGHDRCLWDASQKEVSAIDLSSYFQEYEGSFVLYDLGQDAWKVYEMERAALRVSPDSTYKIYDALFGLEAGVITPEDSFMEWDETSYPFPEWNRDQTLRPAMQSSVNWYFQEVDQQLGASAIGRYVRRIGYGNEDVSGGLSGYWMESSLKISPIEQVELLQKLYENSFGFRPETIQAVKDSIHLSTAETGNLYGKTGTGRIDGLDKNGWFIGYVEAHDNTWFFAANITGEEGASGSRAAEITRRILSAMDIWES